MRSFSNRWLAGAVLALAVLAGWPAALLLRAQPPGTAFQPPSTAPPGTGGSAPGMMPGGGRAPALPATRSSASLQRSGDLLRLTRNVPGDAKPILIDADEI